MRLKPGEKLLKPADEKLLTAHDLLRAQKPADEQMALSTAPA